jgi:hypothetical protein
MKIDVDVLKGIEHFIIYGLEPGHYVSALLRNDPESYKYAHPLLLKNDMEIHKNHITIINDYIPNEFKGTFVENWKGLSNMTLAEVNEILFLLRLKKCKFTEMIVTEYHEDIPTKSK